MSDGFLIALMAAAVRMAMPILYAALGGLFSERSGVVNIGLEGMMLVGALGGVIGSYLSGSAWVGLLVAMLAGGLLALIHAYFSITLKVDQVVTAIALNILAIGLSSFLFRGMFGITTIPVTVDGFSNYPVPVLSELPGIGQILFNQNILVYLGLLLVPVSWFVLYRTSLGLAIRSVGENPKAADTLGVNVVLIRYGCVIFSGMMAGLGGSFLSLGQFNMFVDNMVAGRGYIAVAAVIFGKYRPGGILVAALLFGVADALQVRLQAMGADIPYQFLLMLPYVVTILALTGLVGRNSAPAASGKAYARE